jgi:hypothetical protein
MTFLLTHNGHIGVLGHSFKIWCLCRNLAFIIATCVELKVDQGHPIHVRILQLKHKQRSFVIQPVSEVYLIYAICRELILLPSLCECFSQNWQILSFFMLGTKSIFTKFHSVTWRRNIRSWRRKWNKQRDGHNLYNRPKYRVLK